MKLSSNSTKHSNGLRLSDAEIRAAFDSDWGTVFPPVLSVKQAAELAQVPVATIYDWRSRGRLAGCSRRAGRHVRIHRDRFLEFIFSGSI